MDTTRASLLIRIRNRQDAHAWGEFDALYRPLLQKYALARGLDQAEADDVVQVCMSAVSEHIADFNYDPKRGRFKGWLRTLVNNHVRNQIRRRMEYQPGSRQFDRIPDQAEPPEELFDRLWLRQHLRHCLELVRSEVSESTYAAFRAYVIDEQPVDQVCEDLKMTKNQVQLIKWRVTQKLTEKMRELLGEAE